MKYFIFLFTFLFLKNSVYSQEKTEKELLATPNKERTAYDVISYIIDLDIDIPNKSISGYVIMEFDLLEETENLQFDLASTFKIDSLIFENKKIENYNRKFRAVTFPTPKTVSLTQKNKVYIYYSGKPQIAKKAPWDGGFSWAKDKENKDWIGVSCEGDGASIWWPNKDLLSDEPEKVTFSCTYPKDLFFVSNGNLKSDSIFNNLRKTTWETHHPINNYNVTLNIGNYIHFSDTFKREDKSSLALDYYVLKYNKQKAEKQFKVTHSMFNSFEKNFGRYPFPKDGYALVETPYLGMEHQSAIAYGNKYKKGYLGRYPKNIDFDFIIIHETGHEWWGNSVSMKDRSDMWIHESFCTYSEALFVEDVYGYNSMIDYLLYQKNFISNKSPIQGVPHQHKSGHGSDIYYKGSWVLHTLRNIVDNDELWKKSIFNLAQEFRHKTTYGVEVKTFLEKELSLNLDSFFNIYFDSVDYPIIQIKKTKKGVKIRLKSNLNLSLKLNMNSKEYLINNKWIRIKKAKQKEIRKQLEKKYLVKIEQI